MARGREEAIAVYPDGARPGALRTRSGVMLLRLPVREHTAAEYRAYGEMELVPS